MKHIVSFSGGIGSYMTAKRVVERQGKENTILLFTDTKTEDEDLYRFLVETALDIYGVEDDELINLSRQVPQLEYKEKERSLFLDHLASEVERVLPNFVWLADGRNVWEIFSDERLLGNSLYDPCSKILKRQLSTRYIKAHYKPDECIIYLGIDWSEEHRYERAIPRFLPFEVKAPMCDEPYLSKQDMFEELELNNIEVPRLYQIGFPHNNCGGFCVKAGLGHFKNLLQTMPERYAYHEQKEQEIRKQLGREDIGFLRKTEKGKRRLITMKELRELETPQLDPDDLNDIGGCGCFVEDAATAGSFFYEDKENKQVKL